jgi:DNA-binding transcriptional LysR family regulator
VEFKELEAFVAVAEELHFSRAAERLQIAQPPLSYRIQQLEKQLKIKLFNRNTRSVTLTDAGERLLGPARKVLADVELAQAAVRSVTAGESGRVRLGFAGASSSKILPRLPRRSGAAIPASTLCCRADLCRTPPWIRSSMASSTWASSACPSRTVTSATG